MGVQPEIKEEKEGEGEKERESERERERERETGETSPATVSVLYCSEGLLYF